MAETRMHSLQNRFRRNPGYESYYRAAMEKIFMKDMPAVFRPRRLLRYRQDPFCLILELRRLPDSRNCVWCSTRPPSLEESVCTILFLASLPYRTRFQPSSSGFAREPYIGCYGSNVCRHWSDVQPDPTKRYRLAISSLSLAREG